MEKPEELMKEGFENLSKTRECFEKALIAYQSRSDLAKADFENYKNVKNAIYLLGQSYNEVSAIWENDINV